MKIRPINSHVLVKPLEAGDRTPGGIYLPETAKEKAQEGEVIAVAEDATEEVAVGDRVVYKDLAGTEVELEGQKYLLLASEDLLVKYVALDEIPE